MAYKKQQQKLEKEAAFRQYTLSRCYVFKFFHIATGPGINKAITHENDCLPYMCFVLLFLPLALVDLGPLQHLKEGVFCDKSQRLEAITIATKSSILYVAGLLDPPLSIDKLRQRQYGLSPVFGFHWLNLIPWCFDW